MGRENLVACVRPFEKASPRNRESKNPRKKRNPNVRNETVTITLNAKPPVITDANSDIIVQPIEVVTVAAIEA